jgi:hypothetical protein
MTTKRLTIRVILSLTVFGFVALLASGPLWHFTRPDVSACIGQHHPCDPAMDIPFGYGAIALDLAGVLALLVVATWLVAIFIRDVVRHDAHVRATRRASGH